jgi:hypothetical protein
MSRSGTATVRLRDGRIYVGHVEHDGASVTVDGCLQVVSLVRGQRAATYRERCCRTVALGVVREIVWSEQPESGAPS